MQPHKPGSFMKTFPIREQTALMIAASTNCDPEASWSLFAEAVGALQLPADHPRRIVLSAASKTGNDLGNVTRLMRSVVEKHGQSGIEDTRRHLEKILDGRKLEN